MIALAFYSAQSTPHAKKMMILSSLNLTKTLAMFFSYKSDYVDKINKILDD